ncbi:hypothetical protein C8Q77DRAFT_606623 [Trametes polyzona]|nr:hypothetical protein C8Q77DRAFT_606623 [Trametes polyzona]
MAYLEIAAGPVNACYLVKCDNCGKTSWKVRPALLSVFDQRRAPARQCRPVIEMRCGGSTAEQRAAARTSREGLATIIVGARER